METTCIQADGSRKMASREFCRSTRSTTFKYSTSEQMGRLFDLEENGYFIPVWQTRPMMQSQIRSVSWRAARQQC
mgnify:CR=1 FL=1